jgi:hypothetical protein
MYQGRKFGAFVKASPVGSRLRIIAPIARCRESEYSHFLPNLGVESSNECIFNHALPRKAVCLGAHGTVVDLAVALPEMCAHV